MITATWTQTLSYLCGVCLFSISFLVFLNSSISFVITDVLKQRKGVGDAVGTLGFADELVALMACPLWGAASDRVGFRIVSDPPIPNDTSSFRVLSYNDWRPLGLRLEV